MARPARGKPAAKPGFETTCPRCATDFDVAEDLQVATCPRCSTRMRLTDDATATTPSASPPPVPRPADEPSTRPPRRPLTGRERLAVENALVAPALCALAVNLVPAAFQAGGLGAAATAGALPVGFALASAIVAAATGLRGAGWLVPAGVLLAVGLLWWQDAWVGLIAALYLPVASLVGLAVLLVGFCLSSARGRLARDRLALQVAGLSLTFAVAAVAVQALWFVGQLAGAFG
jgi:hypothetical protein